MSKKKTCHLTWQVDVLTLTRTLILGFHFSVFYWKPSNKVLSFRTKSLSFLSLMRRERNHSTMLRVEAFLCCNRFSCSFTAIFLILNWSFVAPTLSNKEAKLLRGFPLPSHMRLRAYLGQWIMEGIPRGEQATGSCSKKGFYFARLFAQVI